MPVTDDLVRTRQQRYAEGTLTLLANHRITGAEGLFNQALTNGLLAVADAAGVRTLKDGGSTLAASTLLKRLRSVRDRPADAVLDALQAAIDKTDPARHGRVGASQLTEEDIGHLAGVDAHAGLGVLSDLHAALLFWLEDGREGRGEATQLVTAAQVVVGKLDLQSSPEGPRSGLYRRLDDDLWGLVNHGRGWDGPVLVHEDCIAYSKRYRAPAPRLGDEGSVRIERLRQMLEDAAESAAQKGHASITPVMTFGEPSRLWGAVVLLRPHPGAWSRAVSDAQTWTVIGGFLGLVALFATLVLGNRARRAARCAPRAGRRVRRHHDPPG